jgi:hypothetical protein
LKIFFTLPLGLASDAETVCESASDIRSLIKHTHKAQIKKLLYEYIFFGME